MISTDKSGCVAKFASPVCSKVVFLTNYGSDFWELSHLSKTPHYSEYGKIQTCPIFYLLTCRKILYWKLAYAKFLKPSISSHLVKTVKRASFWLGAVHFRVFWQCKYLKRWAGKWRNLINPEWHANFSSTTLTSTCLSLIFTCKLSIDSWCTVSKIIFFFRSYFGMSFAVHDLNWSAKTYGEILRCLCAMRFYNYRVQFMPCFLEVLLPVFLLVCVSRWRLVKLRPPSAHSEPRNAGNRRRSGKNS